ncbi:tRNA synthetases class I, catalytic domain-containing protein [Lipomyces oligophaga]|uniref:tRNA synthetases class I, catalytic domain-containing protein n=1 Tax=Lipomyces oligophaga TaxID=45792 RepID=UPI0034CE6885
MAESQIKAPKAAKAPKGGKGGKSSSGPNFNIKLVNAEDGKVVTRFPPEPSGYLHIGHAKAALLNQYFAQEYHGKLIIRFDDTNPSKENAEFQDAILEDLELMGIKGDEVSYTSDFFPQLYDKMIEMIKEGKAYADDTPVEKMREERTEGIASARRERTVEENLKIFTEDMTNGTEEGLLNCIRAKLSVTSPNKALRDPVMFRCNQTPHHRTGTTWKVYPTYDFACPIVDSMQGVTHALRTSEYRDRNPQYEWVNKANGMRKVYIWDFSRINFVYTLLSKRKLQWFVDQKLVSGWDDPRFPTVRGIRRRGMTIEGLRTFILGQGPSKNILNLDWSLIWATNKKVIDPIAPRFVAIAKNNIVEVTIVGGPAQPYTEEKPRHKKNPAVGTKKVLYSSSIYIEQEDAQTFSEDEEVTLMDWGNAFIRKITKDESGIVTVIGAELHLDGDFRKTDKKITWLAKSDDLTPVDLVDFDYLITKEKLSDTDDVKDFVNPNTEFHSPALADLNIRDLPAGEIIQFERKGYFKLDKAYSKEDDSAAVFFTIPDGKTVQRYGAKSSK